MKNDMTNYNDGEWHGWNGGECPVHPETVVEATTKEFGFVSTKAGDYYGWEKGHGNPILAFRVIKEHKEHVKPREFWVSNNDGYAHETLESVLLDPLTEKHGWVHVREVLK